MHLPYIDLHTHSCLSDGNLEGETLAHGFERELCRPLLEALGV